ncbi:50S ribosome-binding GTPase [Thermosynechococcus sp. PP45]|uniref:GTPase family protein n=1 Tax=unclassified Thermosynechococcus TaxID=2622553 RepID=UPI0026738217|nr:MULTISPECIES: GTPase [unclassified Thermosynechococcus]WKT82166.1 50S ribosome-binding GTPase [Thermosynechococcus sp. PP45]WNC25784.1 GTPase [Thermosynechococcus sp. PP551]WNC28363.1 GTPase [Thermosynechococcus sp. PP555]
MQPSWWQWILLILPLVAIASFILTAASIQIHAWGLSWVWAVVVLILLLWRWGVAHWLKGQPTEIDPRPFDLPRRSSDSETAQRALKILQHTLEQSRQDPPPWENWPLFWQRAQTLVSEIAKVYYPNAQRPLLQIYVPQAYRLLRDTIDDVDRWLETLNPILSRVTLGQAVRAYELSQQVAPVARWGFTAWNWAQWLLNPSVAITKTFTQEQQQKANQALIANLGLTLREQVLKALGLRAIALYSGSLTQLELPTPTPRTDTGTLQDILEQSLPLARAETEPVNVFLVGRTGAGKSSLINSLFAAPTTRVSPLPNTNEIRQYRWQQDLTLWDTPGYEDIRGADIQARLRELLPRMDVVLLLTPALDPALAPDITALQLIRQEVRDLPIVVAVTQVDRLRPLREWHPPYDWQRGTRPKEVSIREAVAYRQEQLGTYTPHILPIVNGTEERMAWGLDALSDTLVNLIAPAKQIRIARWLSDRQTRLHAASRLIDTYCHRITTSQGITDLLKRPVLQFLSTMLTGSPAAAWLLAEQLPLEHLPVILCKLQLAYELYTLLQNASDRIEVPTRPFDLKTLAPLLLQRRSPLNQDTWATGHTLVEFWTQPEPPLTLMARYEDYWQRFGMVPEK